MKQFMVKMSTAIVTMLDSIKSIASLYQPTLPSTCDILNVNQWLSCNARSDVSYTIVVYSNLSQMIKSVVVETLRKEKEVECGIASKAIHNMTEYESDMRRPRGFPCCLIIIFHYE